MSSTPAHLVRSSNNTITYALYRTIFFVAKAFRGEHSQRFYPSDLRQDSEVLMDIRKRISELEDIVKAEGLKTKAKVEKMSNEGKAFEIDLVLFDFHYFLFGIVEKAREEGMEMKKRFDEGMKAVEDRKEAENSDKIEDLTLKMTKMKVEMENKMQDMFQELNKKIEKVQEESKKEDELYLYEERINEMEIELADKDEQLKELKKESEEWYKKESELIWRMEKKDEEKKRLSRNLQEFQAFHVKDEKKKRQIEKGLRDELVNSEEEVKRVLARMEVMEECFENIFREMAEKQKEVENELVGVKKELEEAKKERSKEEESGDSSFDQLEEHED
uniref:DUF4200 domain-containing protein n=1 Tax=Caenorhabditis tropicalis TaxID=1561998 RepID=A0A1I7UH32_9PELO